MEKMMIFLCSIVQNPELHGALEASQLKKALPSSGNNFPFELQAKGKIETYQQPDKNELLQKLEQFDFPKNDGDANKQKPMSGMNGELATSTPLGLRRRPLVKQEYVPEQNVRSKRTSNKRPLPQGSLDEKIPKGNLNFCNNLLIFV